MEILNTCYETTYAIRGLSTYAHLVPAAIMLVLGLFVIVRERNILNISFFSFLIYFVLWFIADWAVWTSNNYHVVNTWWSVLDYVDIIGFIGAVYFYSVFTRGKDIGNIYKLLLTLITVYPLYLVLTGVSILGFDHANCESFENVTLTYYRFAVEIFSILLIIFIASRTWLRNRPALNKGTFILVTLSLLLFLCTFSITGLVASQTYIYEIQLYGMFVLPIFILFMLIAISRYDIFNLRLFNQQLLAWTLVPLVASEYFFLSNITDFTLNTVTLIISFVIVLLIGKSVKKETEDRLRIETLASDLETSNKRQEGLIHFISHEIKGHLTKNEAAFAVLVEGDLGAVPNEVKQLAETALTDTRRGVGTVMDILNASNLKKGTVKFEMRPIDLKQTLLDVINEHTSAATEKGLTLNVNVGDGMFMISGDPNEIKDHVIRNLIDNAIKYTPQGSIDVSLAMKGGKILLAVKDSGIGITDEDKKALFTEGGRGKESVKMNVTSTGYGLFIAKQIVDAHGGRIWAESEGRNKGSTFFVELTPIKSS